MIRLALPALPALVVALSVLTAPADAQSRRELAARLDAVEARLAEVEARALQGDPVAETLMMRVDALEREQRVLTGEVERLTFDNRRLRQELERLGVDVDRLVSGGAAVGAGDPLSLGGGAPLLTPGEIDPDDPFAEARAATVQPLQAPEQGGLPALGGATELDDVAAPARDPQSLFNDGRARLLDGDFGGAREVFRDFTASYPDDALAGQAWYWLGETHFINGDYQDAADAYIASLQTDRQGERGPDALVRLGASLAALGETGRACQVLATFPAEFPRASEEARRKAQREVARLGCR